VGQEIIEFYAKSFQLEYKKAKNELSDLNKEVRKKDVAYMSFYCGIISVAVIVFSCLLAIPDYKVFKWNDESSFKELFTSIYAFRFLFILILIVGSCGVVLKVIR